MKLIDQIVDKLGAAMDARLGTLQSAGNITAINPTAARGPMDLVREALMENRVELHLQPIVQLPQRKTAFYEGFTRLKDANGRLILPTEFIPAAEQAGLMGTIDNVLLFRCVQIVRKLMKQDRRIGIFCNLSPAALADEHFFPQFLDFMRENRDLAGSVIFEIPQDSYENRTSIEARAMAKLVDLGFRFSIDRVTNTEIDLPDLERSGVRYVKVAAARWSTKSCTAACARALRSRAKSPPPISRRSSSATASISSPSASKPKTPCSKCSTSTCLTPKATSSARRARSRKA
jgi:cyclic-di-GMP phosphodiesterase TipF (flagellum assembly factor)